MDYNKKQLVNGREVSIIATYHDDEIDKDYIIYTDETKTPDGKLNIIYGSYVIVDGEIKAYKLTNANEEKKILEVLKIVTTETLQSQNK